MLNSRLLTVASVIAGCLGGCASAGSKSVEEVHFVSDGRRLAGDLYTPGDPRPRPAVVIVHGSGGSDRDGPITYYRRIAEWFCTQGFVVLTYDKPGVRESEGNWRTADFPEMARDAAAAHAFLAADPRVDPSSVGFWGISQAGWIMPLAANAVERCAFIISVSAAGTGVTPAEQNLYDIGQQAQARGRTPEQIEITLRAWRALYRATHSREARDLAALDAAIDELSGIPNASSNMPLRSSQIRWAERDQWFLALDLDYDAVPEWREVPCPILALYGAQDRSTPVGQVVSRFRAEVFDPDRGDVLRIIEGGTHTLLQGRVEASAEFEPDYLDTMGAWLERIMRE